MSIIIQYRLERCILSVLGGFLTHLSLGAFYLWGNIILYATSYYRLHGEPNLQTSTMQLVFPFIYLGQFIGQFIGVQLARKIGHKLTSSLIMLVYGIGVYLASISNFYGFVITMGFLSGFCLGNEYLIPVDNAYYYYPERKGLISGLILSGVGFSAVIFNPLVQYLINPEGESPINGYYSPDIANNLPKALWKMSLIYFVIGIIGAMMMQQTKEYVEAEIVSGANIRKQLIENESQQEKYQGFMKLDKNQSSMEQDNRESLDYGRITVNKTTDLFQNKDIYILFFLLYLTTGFGFMSASNYKAYGQQNIKNDDNYFVIVGSFGAAANGLSKFFWSALLDYIQPNTLLFMNILLMIFLSSTLDLIAYNKTSYLLWIVLIYFQYGGLFTYFPTVCIQLYGKKFGPEAWNFIFMAVVISNFTQFFLVLYTQKSIGYKGIFHIYTGLGGAALLLLSYYQYQQRIQIKQGKVVISDINKSEFLKSEKKNLY